MLNHIYELTLFTFLSTCLNNFPFYLGSTMTAMPRVKLKPALVLVATIITVICASIHYFSIKSGDVLITHLLFIVVQIEVIHGR